MGIPNFFPFLTKRYPACYEDFEFHGQLRSLNVDHLYVDVNPLLWFALRNGQAREDMHLFFESFFKSVQQIVDFANPQKSVYFALDGPGTEIEESIIYLLQHPVQSLLLKEKDEHFWS